MNSKYSYSIQDDVLCIVDLYDESVPSKTVTNDVKNVLAEIKAEIKTLPRMIIYRDTDKYWDRIVINENQRFSFFAPINPGADRPTNFDQAFKLIKNVSRETI